MLWYIFFPSSGLPLQRCRMKFPVQNSDETGLCKRGGGGLLDYTSSNLNTAPKNVMHSSIPRPTIYSFYFFEVKTQNIKASYSFYFFITAIAFLIVYIILINKEQYMFSMANGDVRLAEIEKTPVLSRNQTIAHFISQ